VGEIEQTSQKFGGHYHNETTTYLFTHLVFSIGYNGDNIISCNLTTDVDQRKELSYDRDVEVEFSYSTKWVLTPQKWENRAQVHHQYGEELTDIHWLSIVNSFVLVILLVSFLAILLMRVLKKDFARYMDTVDDEESGEEEVGWKLVHGDVFRFPDNVMFLSAVIGTGTQLFLLACFVMILACFGTFYPGNRGAVYTAAIFLYAMTASVAGYVATKMYVQMGGTRWALNSILSSTVFAGPLFLVFCINNTVAISYGSSSALPFATIAVIILVWSLVTFPLTVLGSMRGRSSAQAEKFDAPCKTNRVEREIPECPSYRHPVVIACCAGFLPFSAIYVELHSIFASVWGHSVYTLFGILAIVFVLLIIVTCFVSVALTYVQLAYENYHWWWNSILSGASTGFFIYAYAAFFFHHRSFMSGTLQSAFFFGYAGCIAYAFSLMLGAVSFWTSKKFVHVIYGSIKVD
jgi:hypothetical protein